MASRLAALTEPFFSTVGEYLHGAALVIAVYGEINLAVSSFDFVGESRSDLGAVNRLGPFRFCRFEFGSKTDGLIVFATIPVHRDAFQSFFPGIHVDLGDIRWGGRVRQVDG